MKTSPDALKILVMLAKRVRMGKKHIKRISKRLNTMIKEYPHRPEYAETDYKLLDESVHASSIIEADFILAKAAVGRRIGYGYQA